MAGARAIQGGVDLLRKIAFNSSQSCSALTIPRCGDGMDPEIFKSSGTKVSEATVKLLALRPSSSVH